MKYTVPGILTFRLFLRTTSLTLDRPKIKNLTVVLEGFLVLIVVHHLGGNYLAPFLLKNWPELPLITAAAVATSDISSLIAIVYLTVRVGSCPTLITGTHIVSGVIAGMLLAWFVIFLGLFGFDKTNSDAQQILTLPTPYVYHGIFSMVVWNPLLEEILARGYFFELLRRRWTDFHSALISTCLFVIPHGIWGSVGPGLTWVAFYSLIFTFVYVHSGVLGAALVHLFVNGYLFYLTAQSPK